MKKLLYLLLLPLLLACPQREPATRYTPVYMKRGDLEKSVQFAAARPLRTPGKLYVKGDTLYLCEKYEGVHVIDNRDPSAPNKLGFIVVPGCVDVAIKGNVLYADNAVDMVSVDLALRREVHRLRQVFPPLVPPDGGYFQHPGSMQDMVVIRWKLAPEGRN